MPTSLSYEVVPTAHRPFRSAECCGSGAVVAVLVAALLDLFPDGTSRGEDELSSGRRGPPLGFGQDAGVRVGLPAVTATCSNGTITGLSPLDAATRRFGYTPIPRVPGTRKAYHLPGDQYAGDGGRWMTGVPVATYGVGGKEVTLEFRASVAASYVELKGNALLLGRELPYVWLVVTQTLSCSGAVSTTITYSDTPSLSVYRGAVQSYTDR